VDGHDDEPSFSLDGQVAVVTGAAGLYGQHIAGALAGAGAHVALAARGVEACAEVADQLRARGLSASAHHVDLGSEQSIKDLRAEVVASCGRIDVLVNNAVARGGGDMRHTSAEDWARTSAVNSLGLFLVTRECGEQMIAQRSGSIVNIASIYGMVGPDFAIYGSTGMTNPAFYAFDKGGMVNFTRYLAAFYAPYGIRANCLSPGGLATPDQPAEFVAAYESRVPLGRLAGPGDIKGPVVFLASSASAYVTGVNLPVDGGWTAH
jgi:NAD(P)-dependent dehydrogenase (short-subunit alcohol dehydrogenase family)